MFIYTTYSVINTSSSIDGVLMMQAGLYLQSESGDYLAFN